MTRKDAIEIMKQVCAQARATMQEHQMLKEAIRVLESEVEDGTASK